MDLWDRLSTRPSTHILSIIRYLPVWRAALNVPKQGQQRLRSVAATDALLLTDADVFFPGITPAHTKFHFVVEPPTVAKFIERLGGKRLNGGDYAIKHVCPFLPEDPPDDLLPIICRFLDHLVDVTRVDYGVLRHYPLIADRTGRLRFGRDLFINGNEIFSAAFEGKDEAFPHHLFDNLALHKFGVQTAVTKANFIRCARNLEKDYETSEAQAQATWTRCRTVWNCFNQIDFSDNPWTTEELGELGAINFVPLLQTPTTASYRDDYIRELVNSNVVSTLHKVVSPTYIPIAWTQRVFTSTPPASFLRPIGFAPTIADVVEHLVALSTNFSAKCTMKQARFFEDLAKTYDYLNSEDHLIEASTYLIRYHPQKKVWLNEGLSLHNPSKFSKPGLFSDTAISSLAWLSAASILHGVPYDLPTFDLYSAKSSLEPYRNLLRACGSEVVENVEVVTKVESVEDHGNYILGLIRDMMKKQDNTYDMKICIQGHAYFAHRVLLGAVSPVFCGLCYGAWKEKETGELNLDSESYGTPDSVGSVIEWVYNGFLKLDDGALPEDEVNNRLDHYLAILELSNVWDITALRAHIENRILNYADKFIRVENVSAVLDLAERYEAIDLMDFCENFMEKNRRVVELVEKSPEPE